MGWVAWCQVESLHDAGVRYPVNALRNAALSMAETDLVSAATELTPINLLK
jgi:hypothetical protein